MCVSMLNRSRYTYRGLPCFVFNDKHIYQFLNPPKPIACCLLFTAVLSMLQPIQIEEVDPVFQIGGLSGQIIMGEVLAPEDMRNSDFHDPKPVTCSSPSDH